MDNKKELIDEIDDFLNSLENIKSSYIDYQFQHEYEYSIDIIDNIVVVFSSDVHFGSIYTDYKELLKIWKLILGNKNVFLIVVGDFIDNFEIPVPKLLQSAINTQIITPELQRDLYTRFLTSLAEKKKLIAVVLGNHEDFTPTYPFVKILQEKKIPVAKNRLYLTLKIGFTEYKIALIHKSRYNSSLNPLHSSIRELMLLYPQADIVVTSHTHVPCVAVYPYPTEKGYSNRILIKTGTLKHDPFQSKYFSPYNVSKISTPAVILDRFSKKILPFIEIEHAIKICKYTFLF